MRSGLFRIVPVIALLGLTTFAAQAVAAKKRGRRDSKGRAESKLPSPSERVVKTEDGRELISLDFKDVDIKLVIKFISDLTGKNFILDDRVRGPVTVLAPTKIPVSHLPNALAAILETRGYVTVPAGDLVKIVPTREAIQSAVLLPAEGKVSCAPDQMVVSRIVPLHYAEPRRIRGIVQAQASKYAMVSLDRGQNSLIVTDTAPNVERLTKLIEDLDHSLKNRSIRNLIRTVSEKTGKNFVLGRGVRGQVTTYMPSKISEGKELDTLKTVLDAYGFKMEPEGEITKIVRDPTKPIPRPEYREEFPRRRRKPEGEKSRVEKRCGQRSCKTSD